MTYCRPVAWRASLIDASTASVPELVRNTLLVARDRRARDEPLRQLRVDRRVEVARAVVDELAGLGRDRVDDRGMAVAGRRDRDARVEVEEAVAVDVLDHEPDARARARAGRRGPSTGW